MSKFDEQDPILQRLREADPASSTPSLNASVVAKAALGKTARPTLSWRLRRNLFSGAGVVTASVAIFALAVGMQQPLIKLGNSGAGGLAEASSDRAMSFMPFTYEYVAGIDLSRENGRGGVWQLELVGEPRQRLAQLADRFGFTGEVTRDEWSSAEMPSFSISEESKYLSIYWGGTGGWSFSSWDLAPVCSEPAEAGVEPGVEAGDTGVEPDVEMQPESGDGSAGGEVNGFDPARGSCDWALEPTPELIPSNAEITAQALDLFAATGLEVSPSDIRVYRDEWGASASAALRVADQATSIEWYVGWNSSGELSYASGHSVIATSRGEYRTISPVAAVDRLGDWRWYGSVASEIYEEIYGGGLERGAVSAPAESFALDDSAGTPGETDSPAGESGDQASAEAPADEATPYEDKPETEPGFDIMPVYPEGEQQLVTLTVNESRAVLLTIYDAGGAAWLVPGYLMFNSEGFFDAVIALEDGVIELPEPLDFDIMPRPADLGLDNLVDE